VPEDWRKANGTLVFIKGKKEDPGNYRPVSHTFIPGKMMERARSKTQGTTGRSATRSSRER